MAAPSPSNNEILTSISSIQNEAISFLKTLVSIDSTLQKGEHAVQSIIYYHLQQILKNFDIQRLDVYKNEICTQFGYSPVNWEYENKFNVIASSHPTNSSNDSNTNTTDKPKKSLILQGHIDVVPATPTKWTTPPFTPRIENGRMYGRGAGDMKAGVVAMIYAVVALERLGYRPAGQIKICTVVEEECTGNGALACLSTLLPSSSDEKVVVIIPEPFPFITTAQLGVLWFTVNVTGKPCHVLQTSSGSNAIEGAFALFSALKPLEAKYNTAEYRKGVAGAKAYEGMDHPINFNLGRIEGGDWASSVPSQCWFEARVGFFPGVEIGDVKREVESTLIEAAEKIGVEIKISYRGFHARGAVLLPEYVDGSEEGDGRELQRDFVELLQDCHVAASSVSFSSENKVVDDDKKKRLQLLPITCTTDARFYSSIHHNPEDVVVTCYGPEATNIHGVDESVSLESMRTVTAAIALFIRDWCGLVKDGND